MLLVVISVKVMVWLVGRVILYYYSMHLEIYIM